MKVILIGSGNTAWHIGHALKKAGHTIESVYSRNIITSAQLSKKLGANHTNNLSDLPARADLYLVCLPDKETLTFLKLFPYKNRTIAHTSGALPLHVFPASYSSAGVFYPLQTMTKGKKLEYRNIPLCIEARDKRTLNKLRRIARSISNTVLEADSVKRGRLHLAAVFVNNFSNHLFYIAEQLLNEKALPFDLLRPLIAETSRKVQDNLPGKVQTGPAIRRDHDTTRKHLHQLEKHPDLQKIYRILSKSIEKKRTSNS